MNYIADLHIHSKYSRATSKEMDVEHLVRWAKVKGVSMLGTGDFTHPSWLAELERKLGDCEGGVYRREGVDFVLSAEVANIFYKGGRGRKVHIMLLAPGFKAAKEVNKVLSRYGDLSADGRPVLGLECDRMVKELSAIDPGIAFIPAHAWTPHFGIFGSRSGFDSPEECFGDQLPKIFSIETGMSSDPAMNWRVSALDRFTLTSHSDAHSPSKIGREANVFKDRISYHELLEILKAGDKKRFLHTIEFFPEEGKYHWDGHRSCGVAVRPQEALRADNICPSCGRKLTIGVLHRVEELADRDEGFVLKSSPPFRRAVPLAEIMSDVLGVGPDSKAVAREYFQLISRLGPEIDILLYKDEKDIRKACPAAIAEAILNVRNGGVSITPGYDGEYGKVKVAGKHTDSRSKEPCLL